jgi:hypothetical protein
MGNGPHDLIAFVSSCDVLSATTNSLWAQLPTPFYCSFALLGLSVLGLRTLSFIDAPPRFQELHAWSLLILPCAGFFGLLLLSFDLGPSVGGVFVTASLLAVLCFILLGYRAEVV